VRDDERLSRSRTCRGSAFILYERLILFHVVQFTSGLGIFVWIGSEIGTSGCRLLVVFEQKSVELGELFGHFAVHLTNIIIL